MNQILMIYILAVSLLTCAIFGIDNAQMVFVFWILWR